MLSSRTLYAAMVLLLALPACAKKGQAPGSQSSTRAEATSATMARAGSTANAPNWESSPAPPAFLEEPAYSRPKPKPEPVASAAPAVALTDEQIIGITETVDQGAIAQAKLAQQKAKNARVKEFAAHMISQHSKSKQEGEKLVKQNNLTVANSIVGTDLESKATQQLEKLKTADATDFDRAYTEGEVAQHQAVLDLLDKQLIPNASHPELKAQLEESRGMVEKHLNEAKDIQVSLAEP